MLGWLAAAKDVKRIGQKTLPGIARDSANTTFEQYSFNLDSAKYASQVRDVMQQELNDKGELPPGITPAIPNDLATMQASGQLWLHADGTPARMTLDANLPNVNGSRAALKLDVSYFGYKNTTSTGLIQQGWRALSQAWGLERTQQGLAQFSLGLSSSLLVLLMVLAYIRIRAKPHTPHVFQNPPSDRTYQRLPGQLVAAQLVVFQNPPSDRTYQRCFAQSRCWLSA